MPTKQLNKHRAVSAIQQSMLVRFGQFGRHVHFFTLSVNGYQALALAVAEFNLAALEDLGLIVETHTGFKLTAKGRARVDAPGGALDPGATLRRPDYVPAKWECARGAPAVEHLQYKSLPSAAQIGVA